MKKSPKKPGRKPIAAITETQERVYHQVRDYIAAHGMPPSTQELAKLLQVSSATAHEQVVQLVRKGYLSRDGRKARGLRVAKELDAKGPAQLVSIPLVGAVAAGPPIVAEENIEGEVLVDKQLVANGPCFALRVKGQSMRDSDIRDGDLVVVRQQPVAENNAIVVAMIDGEATIKRLSIQDHAIELVPANPKFKPRRIGPEDDLKILGKVIAVRRL